MSEISTNLGLGGTNILAEGTNVASTVTNASAPGTNAASALADSANAAVVHHCCLFSSNSFTVLSLMASGVILGSVGSFCYQRHALASEKSRDKLELLKILGMGVAAVALVPAFLRTVASNLIQETQNSFEAKLVLLAFCVAATIVARRLIGTFPEKLFNLVKEQQAGLDAQKEAVTKITEVVADIRAAHRDEPTTPASPPAASPTAATTAEATVGQNPPTEPGAPIRRGATPSAVTGYDWKAVLIVRALLNPRYRVGRTLAGVAFDSGLTVTDVQHYLQLLQERGDVAIFTGNPIKGPLWHLTRLGRQRVGNLRFDDGNDSVADVGIE